MLNRLNLISIVFLCSVLEIPCSAAPPPHLSSCYIRYDHEGMIDIPPYSVVEGSYRNGGLQPDYLIDTGTLPLKQLLERSKEVGSSSLPFWEKIRKIQELIHLSVPSWVYAEEKGADCYVALMKEYRANGIDGNIPLSAYIDRCGHAVCRECALLTHLALKAAGIPSHYTYAKVVFEGDPPMDHAIVLVNYEGKKWIIDSYEDSFNGFLWEDAILEGIPEVNRLTRAPISYTVQLGLARLDSRGKDHCYDSRKILQINPYPRIWKPKPDMKCSQKTLIARYSTR